MKIHQIHGKCCRLQRQQDQALGATLNTSVLELLHWMQQNVSLRGLAGSWSKFGDFGEASRKSTSLQSIPLVCRLKAEGHRGSVTKGSWGVLCSWSRLHQYSCLESYQNGGGEDSWWLKAKTRLLVTLELLDQNLSQFSSFLNSTLHSDYSTHLLLLAVVQEIGERGQVF